MRVAFPIILLSTLLAACVGGDVTSDAGPSDVGMDVDTGPQFGETSCAFFMGDCPDDQTCYSTTKGPRCAPFNGEASVGDACQNSLDCSRRQRCFEGSCRQMCDPSGTHSDWSCLPDSACMGVTVDGESQPWGICEPVEDECTLWPDDDCPSGESCFELSIGKRCRAHNSDASVGDDCTESTDCNQDQTCVEVLGTDEQTCRPKCDGDHPCDEGECAELQGRPFDACFSTSE